MDFIDDEVEATSDGGVHVPSSQSVRNGCPRKKRRLKNGYHSVSEDEDVASADDYDLPPNKYDDGDLSVDEFEQYKSKYEDRTHVPEYAQTQKDVFVTQLTQPWSSPTRIRGPRWRKQVTPPTCVSRTKPSDRSAAQQKPMPAAPPPHLMPLPVSKPPSPPSADKFDDDDLELLEAFMSSPLESMQVGAALVDPKSRPNEHVAPRPNTSAAPSSMRQTTLFGIGTTQRKIRSTQTTRTHNWPLANKVEAPTHHAIDTEAMKSWVYPTNLGRIRDYQYNIVHKGLFHNLLVALPTGLGKTFIAATVMLNWYRWTKDAQIVFVAPTKPLVAQQIKACYGIAGIPKHDTMMLTGEDGPAVREVEWKSKRVFFMTPQTLINDLKSGIADPKKIVLLVVDEAHKATGHYAYVEVVKFLRRFNSSFRVLALTATPGGSVDAVQNVIDGLDIARVEIRTEESIDIRDFVHSRDTKLEVFDNSEELAITLELFRAAVMPVYSQLSAQNAVWTKDPSNMTLYGLMKSMETWMKSEAAQVGGNGLKFKMRAIFQALMKLAHNLELLKFHGIGPFYHKMKIFDNEAGAGKYMKMIVDNEQYKKMMSYMRNWVNNPDFEGHPKLTYLKEVVLNHFMDAGEGSGANSDRGPAETRIMIFAHYRDSAEEISRVLKRHEPMIRPHVFVGQSGTKGSEGMNQQMQLDIIKKFKTGTYNTLVATSIGEEGLDIGEVDLIVCYDCSKSPIRMLQRMGRTGRKRAGNIVVLLMREKEQDDYYRAKDNYEKMQELIEAGASFQFHEDRSPRIVPKEIQPMVDKRIVEIPVENTQDPDGLPRPQKRGVKRLKKPAKKFHMPDDVETGFAFLGHDRKKATKASKEGPVLDDAIAPLPPPEQVLMSTEQEADFDEIYRSIPGNEPQYIQPVRFDAFPDEQRKLSRFAAVKHSRYTRLYVSAIQKMNDATQIWDAPSEADIMQTLSFGVAATMEKLKKAKTSPKSKASKKATSSMKSKKLPTGTSETLRSSSAASAGEYDENDSFIDDDTPGRQKAWVHSPLTSPLTLDMSRQLQAKPSALVEQPRYASQKSALEDESEDDLPDFGDIMGATKMSLADTGKSARRKNARRVVDSDDDEC